MGTTAQLIRTSIFHVIILFGIPAVALWKIGYQLDRTETYRLWVLITIGFLPFIFIFQKGFRLSWQTIVWLGLALRFLLLFALPSLSDDYFRFIWDGRLNAQGINPFLWLPSEIAAQGFPIQGATPELYAQINSPNYYSVYPAVCQAIFWLGALLFPNSLVGHVVVMRCSILLAEAATLFFLAKLLRHFQLPLKNLVWYALNPIVIVELVGNLHFEAFMIMGIAGSLYFVWVRHQVLLASLLFSVAIHAKLLPLMLLPLFFRVLSWKKLVAFYALIAIISVGMFLPFFSMEMVSNMLKSTQLYFAKFEFNASVYYLIRWWGFQTYGYNIIATAGKNLTYLPIGFVVAASLWNCIHPKVLYVRIIWSLAIYYFAATIVHPWYLTPLVAFALFTPYRFPMVWLTLAMLSYATYANPGYQENLWFVAIEYSLVYGTAFYELTRVINLKAMFANHSFTKKKPT